MGRGNRNN
jgi:hypothetical protein